MTGKKYIFIDIGCSFTRDYFFVDNVVYHIDNEKRIVLRCPCGCNDLIILNTVKGSFPCWSVDGNTIKPSVNRTVGCRSHFSITDGIVSIH